MPPKGSNRPNVMTWGKAIPVLVIAVVFDALRFIFEQFWFFGPVLLGLATKIAASQYLGNFLGAALGGAVAGVAGFFGGGAFQAFGAVIAIALGLFGWLTIGLLLAFINARIFKTTATSMLWSMLGLGVSVTPVVGTLPGLTLTTLRLYHAQIKNDKEALAKWNAEQKALQARMQQKIAELALMRRASEEVRAEAKEIPETEAAAA